MENKITRIDIIEYDHIGKAVHRMINNDPKNGMEAVFIQNMEPESLKGMSEE